MRLPRSLPSLASVAVLVIAIVLLIRSGSGEDPRTPAPKTGTAHVTRAIDGDTIEVRYDGATEDVRYIGVDTPETVKPDTPVQCFGPEAHELNARLVEGHDVRLEFDAERRDVYGRLLAYVRVGDEFVNAKLVRRGYATTLTIPPNDRYADEFARMEREASTRGLGLWGAC
jgi:micrococcal nuclease